MTFIQGQLVSSCEMLSQTAIIHINDMQTLGIHHGSIIQWCVNDKTYICVAVAYNNSSQDLPFYYSTSLSRSQCVCSPGEPVIQALVSKSSHSLDEGTFRILQQGEIEYAEVTVCISDQNPEAVIVGEVENNVRLILNQCFVVEDCSIHCALLSISLLTNVQEILVNRLTFHNSIGECGKTTKDTKIKVNIKFVPRLADVKLSKDLVNLIGLDEQKRVARTIMNSQLTRNKGLVLIGPSGCGKSAFVNWLANSISAHVVVFQGSDVLRDSLEAEEEDGKNSKCSFMFRLAADKARAISRTTPCILLIDKIDEACSVVSRCDDSLFQRLFEVELQSFCESLDTCDDESLKCEKRTVKYYDLILIASTSKRSAVSENVKRLFTSERKVINSSNMSLSSLFPKQKDHRHVGFVVDILMPDALPDITFSTLNSRDRGEIIGSLLPSLARLSEDDVRHVSDITPGFTAADLRLLVDSAHRNVFENQQNTDSTSPVKYLTTRVYPEGLTKGLKANFRRQCKPYIVETGKLIHLKKDREGQITKLTVDNFKEALKKISPSCLIHSEVKVETPSIGYESIAGYDNVKTQLIQAIEWPLRHAAAMRRIGATRRRGILLHGPPGCGKTTLVKAAAASAHVNFLSVTGAQLYSAYQGQSEKNITLIFDQARAAAPSILFIDEIDSVVGSRSMADTRGRAGGGASEGGGVNERVMTSLLNQLDGIGQSLDSALSLATGDEERRLIEELESDVVVVAATNRLDMIDKALLRPGRIDTIIHVPLPDKMARMQIIQLNVEGKAEENLDLDDFADKTEGLTGADIKSLVNQAGLMLTEEKGDESRVITSRHLYEALANVRS